MKKLLGSVMVCFLLAGFAFAAFKSDIAILDKSGIEGLSDDKLIDAYTDVLVDIEAQRTFYEAAGFSKQQHFDEYKDLLRYRLRLLMAIHTRQLEIPAQMER